MGNNSCVKIVSKVYQICILVYYEALVYHSMFEKLLVILKVLLCRGSDGPLLQLSLSLQYLWPSSAIVSAVLCAG